MKKHQNFTEGPIFAPLVRFALPVPAALLLQTMYGAVDLLVVGQFGSAADVSAVSTGSMLMNSVTVVITGTAMGLTVLVGRKNDILFLEGEQKSFLFAVGYSQIIYVLFTKPCTFFTNVVYCCQTEALAAEIMFKEENYDYLHSLCRFPDRRLSAVRQVRDQGLRSR